MKKHIIYFLLLALGEFGYAGGPYSRQMVASHGLGDFYCNTKYKSSLKTAGWDYVSGLVASAVLRAWEVYPENEYYYNAVKTFADNSIADNGNKIVDIGTTKSALGESNLDDLAAGKIFFTLYNEEMKRGNIAGAQKYRNAANLIRNTLKYNHERIPSSLPGAGGFIHKARYPYQMWLDGLYMGVPVYAEWQAAFGGNSSDDDSCWSDIALQFKIIHRYTYDSIKQLNYHGWSANPEDENSFWANKNTPHKGCSSEFWGRGMGWYFAGVVDVLGYMPKSHPDYDVLVKICNQVAAGLKRWQAGDSHVWYQLLQYDGNFTAGGKSNYMESSCSCMFTYAFFKGIRLGILDKDTYLPVALNAYQGILDNFIKRDGDKTDIIQSCASAGLGPARSPDRTGTANYYLCGRDVRITENEGKAIGPFIFASVEKELYDAESENPDTINSVSKISDSYKDRVAVERICSKNGDLIFKSADNDKFAYVYACNGNFIRKIYLKQGVNTVKGLIPGIYFVRTGKK